ncbi:hypothetical protein [Ruegeria alba]|uniref:hypothetical protein n=1 Tax=Ruegeria alba TaxID=2916756 RepID=UPI003F70F763
MLNLSDLSSFMEFGFPRSIIGHAVRANHRFALSPREVEDLLATGPLTQSRFVCPWRVANLQVLLQLAAGADGFSHERHPHPQQRQPRSDGSFGPFAKLAVCLLCAWLLL